MVPEVALAQVEKFGGHYSHFPFNPLKNPRSHFSVAVTGINAKSHLSALVSSQA